MTVPAPGAQDTPSVFKRLLLVSAFRASDYADSFSPEDTLIVTPNLVAASLAARIGFIVVNPDTIIASMDYTDAVERTNDMRLRGCDWIFDGSIDLTIFMGSSLGRKFLITGMHALAMYNYLDAVLVTLFKRHGIQELHHFGYSTGYPIDADCAASDFIAAISAANGVECHEHATPTVQAHAAGGVRQRLISWARLQKSAISTLVMRTLGAVSKFFNRAGRPKVLVVATHLNAARLLERSKNSPIELDLLADNFPNRRNLVSVIKKLIDGVGIVSMPAVKLTSDEMNELDSIKLAVRMLLARQGNLPPAIRQFIQKHMLYSEKFDQHAATVKQARTLLVNLAPALVFTDSLSNSRSCAIMEQAKQLGISTASTWHAPLVHEIKSYLLGSDPRVNPVVDVVYNWGIAQDLWLQRTQARCASTITGTMLRPKAKRQSIVLENFRKVLLLEYFLPPTDVTFRPFEKYTYFVDAVRMLNRIGVDVIYRLHPSHHGLKEYRDLCQHFNLRCSFDDGASFLDSINRVDAVIGPGHSGAMLESLMAGVAYFPVLLPPHGVPMHYFESCPVFSDIAGLEAALGKAFVWPDAFLQRWTSERNIPDPVQKVLQVMQENPSASSSDDKYVR